MYTTSGLSCASEFVPFVPLQPKNVGLAFKPRFTNVCCDGIDGNAVPFCMVLFRLRSYVATRDVPLGQVSVVSAELSMAKMTSTCRCG